jgi:hypothetical protein
VSLAAIVGIVFLALLIGWIGFVMLALASQVTDEVDASDDPLRRTRP